MASKMEGTVYDDPNFAVICSFMSSYAKELQFPDISFNALKSYLGNTKTVHRLLEDIFIRLLRKWRKGRCGVDEWEKVLVKFCHSYSSVDAWELERFGFPRCKLSTKLRITKNLLETQFDCNPKFKEKLNTQDAEQLRILPIGRDKHGMAYWLFLDKDSNVRVYREEQDDTEACQSWSILVKDYEGLQALITRLEDEKDKVAEYSRSVTPLYGSRSDTPSIVGSRCDTPAMEGKEEFKAEIKEEILDEDDVKPASERAPLKLIIKREPGEKEIKVEQKPDITEKNDEGKGSDSKKPFEDSDKENSNRETTSGTKPPQSELNGESQSQVTQNSDTATADKSVNLSQVALKLQTVAAQESVTNESTNKKECDEQGKTFSDKEKVSQVDPATGSSERQEKPTLDTKTCENSLTLEEAAIQLKNEEAKDPIETESCEQEQINSGKAQVPKFSKSDVQDNPENAEELKQSNDQSEQEKFESDETKNRENDSKHEESDDTAKVQDVALNTIDTSKQSDICASEELEKSEDINNCDQDVKVQCKSSKKLSHSIESILQSNQIEDATQNENKGSEVSTSACDKDPTSDLLNNKPSEDITKSSEESLKQCSSESKAGNEVQELKLCEENKFDSCDKTSTSTNQTDITENVKPVPESAKSLEDNQDDKTNTSSVNSPVSPSISPNNSRVRRVRKFRKNVLSEKDQSKSPEDAAKSREKLRKRKRGGVESESETESHEVSEHLERKQNRSESELSETSQSDGESKDESGPPTKRRRDKFLKKRKPVRPTTHDSTSDSEEPEKKSKKRDDEEEKRPRLSDAPKSPSQSACKLESKTGTKKSEDIVGGKGEGSERTIVSEAKSDCIPEAESAKTAESDKEDNVNVDKSPSKETQEDVVSNEKNKPPPKGEQENLETEQKEQLVATKKKRGKRKEVKKDDEGKEEDCEVTQTKRGKRVENDTQPEEGHNKEGSIEEKAASPESIAPIASPECKKKRGKRREEEAKEDMGGGKEGETEAPPESKRPCPPANTTPSRGRRAKQKAEPVPVECLRRSSRANKGQRLPDPGIVQEIETPRKKRAIKPPQADKQEDEPQGKRERKSKKDLKQQRKTEKASSKKKKRGRKATEDEDTDYVAPCNARGGSKKRRGRPAKYGSTSDEDEQDNDDDDEHDELVEFIEGEESDPLHWSSPSETEYELDSDGEEYQPKGRNAKRQAQLIAKEKSGAVVGNDDTPCQRCGKYDQPQWILLCDECESGYHTACLRPPLMLIPDGDWFCPTCEHVQLIARLSAKLKELDGAWKKRDALDRRKQRLKYVGINLDNILQDEKPKGRKKRIIKSSASEDENESENKNETKNQNEVEEDSDATDEDQGHWETLKEKAKREQENRKANINSKYYYDWGTKYVEEANTVTSSSETESESSSTEEEYSMVANRSRRQRKEIKYNFEEYDDLIKTAITEEDAITEYRPNPRNRGKDISNIEEAYAREKAEREAAERRQSGYGMGKGERDWEEEEKEEKEKEEKEEEKEKDEDTEEEGDQYRNKPSPVLSKAKKTAKKKGRRLNALSEDEVDEDTDEYRASDDEPSASDNYSDGFTDDSLVNKSRSRKHGKGTRRSSRRRRVLARMDDFVVDEYDSEEERRSYRRSKRPTRGGRRRRCSSYDSEEDSVDSEYYSDSSDSIPKSRRRGGQSGKKSVTSKHKKSDKKKRKRKMKYSEESGSEASGVEYQRKRKTSKRYEEDSEWEGSEENFVVGKRAAAKKRISYKEPAWSGSDTEPKKKGKMDVSKFVKESDEASATDEYAEEDDSNVSNEDSGPVTNRKPGDKAITNNSKSGKSGAKHKDRRIKRPVSSSSDENDEPTKPKTDTQSATPKRQDSQRGTNTDDVGKTRALSSPELGNNPVTYTFKAKMNGHRQEDMSESCTVSSSNKIVSENKNSVGNAQQMGGYENTEEESEEEQTDTEVDDDLSDIGDIVDYITQDA